ncbi:PAS-domain containing protein [Aliiglaciecola sp. CAU 1673]|uniref:hybrid sensor histidine kinase/response regulator n=1 Tax=Aliiglaciecola sp. CAU 1673 TaxID=3032595 RepID=UPI0023DCC21E|nr:PAS-domain containing protein [Aliiglaciecola sp. CAU 1673]MDF2179957.1 PAS-domain containing protein [Aliiglaciecola sp. CAU 1673]
MFSIWLLTSVALCYLVLLFVIGFWGEKRKVNTNQRPWIYSLALGVHCTTWAFFGTVGQSAMFGWAFTPTYMGSILAFALGFPLLLKLAAICQRHHISSVADFLGWQYGRSHFIAAVVTLLCLIGVLPYTAIQLDALTDSVTLLSAENPEWSGSISFYVAATMALFAIFFGARSLNLTEKHPGLMLTIAFESLVKLFAFVALGLFVCYAMFNGLFDLLGQVQLNANAKKVLDQDWAPLVYASHVLLGFCSMFCLPRQFHINFVENQGEQELRHARWVFPLYLMAINLFVLPIALAGQILLPDADADTLILSLPMLANSSWASMIAFLGGLAAATSMIIVATLAMGIMVANNLITPLWLKVQLRRDSQGLDASSLLNIRRLTIVLVLGLAYLYSGHISQSAPLVNSGIIAMALLAQLAVPMLLGLYHQQPSRLAAICGMTAGCILWVLDLLWPSITSSYYFDPRPSDHQLAWGVFQSLGLNALVYAVVTFVRRGKSSLHLANQTNHGTGLPLMTIEVPALLSLCNKVLPVEQVKQLNEGLSEGGTFASQALIDKVEQLLAAQVGGASARILLSAITARKAVRLDELVGMVEEASQSYQFNHELLRASVEHIEQGISVVDRDLKLLAWNRRYLDLFQYPPGFIRAGMTLEEILRFNASRGLLATSNDLETEIAKRMELIRQGSSYAYQRQQPDGKIIALQGNPMPSGGFVTTYSDITQYIQTQEALEQAKTGLERRVDERTYQLRQTNAALAEAKQEAERANESKTKFLAAASHDLMQPFNAATLYAGLISQRLTDQELRDLTTGLQRSLSSAEELLQSLLDMTRLDAGVLKVNIQPFALNELLEPLIADFRMMAEQKGLALHWVPCRAWVNSDRKLLRRVIQNLISNAIRYTPKGKVLVGVRHQNNHLVLQVWDTGHGIAFEQQQKIFEEFHQGQHNDRQGLGLGLTIVDKISKLLGISVSLHSTPGSGSCFSLSLARHEGSPKVNAKKEKQEADTSVHRMRVLVVDNDPEVLQAMLAQLRQWGAKVEGATDFESACQKMPKAPEVLLMDYHLDNGVLGTELAKSLFHYWQSTVPTIINSADPSEEIREEVQDAGFTFLPKPIKPAALKRLLKKYHDQ